VSHTYPVPHKKKSFAGDARLAVRSTGPVRNAFIDEFNCQLEKLWIRLGNKRLGSMGRVVYRKESVLFRKRPRAYASGTNVNSKASEEGLVSNDSEPLLSSMNLSMTRETLLTREILVIAVGKGKCHQAVFNKERGGGAKGSDC
jgi:hypothetical protein